MLDMLNKVIEFGAAWVDVDIDTPDDIIKKVVAKARTKNCRLIISYHSYDKTPSTSILNSTIASAGAYNPALTKIACMANSPNDCARVLSLYEKHSKILAFCRGK
jgi:3-dehydroquinate dehydratase type I